MLGNPYAKLKGLPQVAQPQVTQPKAKKTVTINEEPEVIEIEAFKDEKVRDSIIEIEETEKRKATEEEFRAIVEPTTTSEEPAPSTPGSPA